MNVIIRPFKNSSTSKFISVKNLSISSNVPGISIEVDNYNEMFNNLKEWGFNPQLTGKIINFEACGITCFD